MDTDAIKQLRVVDLKDILQEEGLNTKGRKADLVARLIEFYESRQESQEIGNRSTDAVEEETNGTSNGHENGEGTHDEEQLEAALTPPPNDVEAEEPALEAAMTPEPVAEEEPALEAAMTPEPVAEEEPALEAALTPPPAEEAEELEAALTPEAAEAENEDPEPTEPEEQEAWMMVENDGEGVVELSEEPGMASKSLDPEVAMVAKQPEASIDLDQYEEAESATKPIQLDSDAEELSEDEEPQERPMSPQFLNDDDQDQEIPSPLEPAEVDEDSIKPEETKEEPKRPASPLLPVVEAEVIEDPERVQAVADFKSGKISKAKLKKIKAKLAKKEKKKRDASFFSKSLRADSDTKARRKGKDVKIDVDYVKQDIELDDMFAADPESMYPQDDIERCRGHFQRILSMFEGSGEDPTSISADKLKDAVAKSMEMARRANAEYKKPKPDEEAEEPEVDEEKLSKRKLKQLHRPSVASLKQVATRPDCVEMHDVTSSDPRLLVHLKGYRNTVPVPRHWCLKRKYLTSKRGFEKPPFELPEFIKRTGITEMREALQEKEEIRNRASKQRQKMRPKLGKINIDYEKLHDAFFRYQTKPKMSFHGDLYYEGKELEVRLKERKPGEITDGLRVALGMPIGPHKHRCPPPWLIAMQRYGPPPSYPNLKIPGLNAPIPQGCSFGYHAGGWGKPPVDEYGRPLYGDVFGTDQKSQDEMEIDASRLNFRWGQIETDSESESESEEEEDSDEEEKEKGSDDEADKSGMTSEMPDKADGMKTPGGGMATPSGKQSTATTVPGLDTPDNIQLRKKREIEAAMEQREHKDLYKIIPERSQKVGRAAMGSTHTYDLSGARKRDAGVELSLTADELAMDQDSIRRRMESRMNTKQQENAPEDMSDMLRDHLGHTAKKRKAAASRAAGGEDPAAQKKRKDFKF